MRLSLTELSGLEPYLGHCVVFLGKTLYSLIASLHPGVEVGTGELNAGGSPCDGLASHPEGSRNTPSTFMLIRSQYGSGLLGHLAHMAHMQI